jgi:ParB-like chromosome segregation protein Spo0J
LGKARKISPAAVDKVAVSIKAFRWRQPIVVDAKEGIICGHTRLWAAQELGLTEGSAGARLENGSHEETN